MIEAIARPGSKIPTLSRRNWVWLPLAVAGADLVVLVAQARRLVGGLYTSADPAVAPVIGALIGSAGPGHVVTLGNYPWYESLWFMRLTHGWPAYRQLWELAPFVLAGLTLALVGWTAWRTFGLWAAGMAVAPLLCAGTLLREIWLTLDTHGAVLLHVAVLGAALVLVSGRPPQLRWPTLALAAIVLAAFTAAGATDRLLLVSGVAPFALAGCLMWWRSRDDLQRGTAVFALAVSAGSVAGAALINHVMRTSGVVSYAGYHVNLAPFGHWLNNLDASIEGLANMGSGAAFFGASASLGSILLLVAGLLTLLGAAMVMGWLWREARSLASPAAPVAPAAAGRVAYRTFWGAVVAIVFVSFLVSSLPSQSDPGSARDLAAAYIGIAALLPALAAPSPRLRVVLVAGLTVFACSSLRAHIAGGPGFDAGDSGVTTNQVVRFAQAHGVRLGYAGYAQATPLTWQSRLKLEIFPVITCASGSLCPFAYGSISGWYRARPGTRSMLITQLGTPASALTLQTPYSPAGRPVATATIGGYVVYVYDHDVAGDLR